VEEERLWHVQRGRCWVRDWELGCCWVCDWELRRCWVLVCEVGCYEMRDPELRGCFFCILLHSRRGRYQWVRGAGTRSQAPQWQVTCMLSSSWHLASAHTALKEHFVDCAPC
jgi:hypothetical protein